MWGGGGLLGCLFYDGLLLFAEVALRTAASSLRNDGRRNMCPSATGTTFSVCGRTSCPEARLRGWVGGWC